MIAHTQKVLRQALHCCADFVALRCDRSGYERFAGPAWGAFGLVVAWAAGLAVWGTREGASAILASGLGLVSAVLLGGAALGVLVLPFTHRLIGASNLIAALGMACAPLLLVGLPWELLGAVPLLRMAVLLLAGAWSGASFIRYLRVGLGLSWEHVAMLIAYPLEFVTILAAPLLAHTLAWNRTAATVGSAPLPMTNGELFLWGVSGVAMTLLVPLSALYLLYLFEPGFSLRAEWRAYLRPEVTSETRPEEDHGS